MEYYLAIWVSSNHSSNQALEAFGRFPIDHSDSFDAFLEKGNWFVDIGYCTVSAVGKSKN